MMAALGDRVRVGYNNHHAGYEIIYFTDIYDEALYF